MSSFRSNRMRKPYSRPASRPGADGQWLHDKAPTGPRASLGNDTVRSRPPTAPASINSKLIVSNLHYEITPKDLTAIFGQIGTLVREPLIRYDRSGRSSGTAIIAFETTIEATRAKKQFDGILAKGQPMSIAYDTMPVRRSASVPASLLNRIQKAPLLDRLSQNDIKAVASGPRGVGPIRSQPIRGRAQGKPPRGPKKPKTAEELDKELDAFMGDSETPAVPPSTSGELTALVDTAAQDVEMV